MWLGLWFNHAYTGPSDQEIKPLIETHSIESPYQSHETSLRVLLPNGLDLSKRYPVLYVLPVHEDGSQKHGDGLMEIAKLNVADRYQVICVAPSFSSEPWYADHDQNPNKRDESHLMKTVMPFIVNLTTPLKGTEGLDILLALANRVGVPSVCSYAIPKPFTRLRRGILGYVSTWGLWMRIPMTRFKRVLEVGRILKTIGFPIFLKKAAVGWGLKCAFFYFNCDGVKRTAGGARLHS